MILGRGEIFDCADVNESGSWNTSDTFDNKENQLSESRLNENASK